MRDPTRRLSFASTASCTCRRTFVDVVLSRSVWDWHRSPGDSMNRMYRRVSIVPVVSVWRSEMDTNRDVSCSTLTPVSVRRVHELTNVHPSPESAVRCGYCAHPSVRYKLRGCASALLGHESRGTTGGPPLKARPQCDPSFRLPIRGTAGSWSNPGHTGDQLLGFDGQRAPNLAPRARVGGEKGQRLGFFAVSWLVAPKTLVSRPIRSSPSPSWPQTGQSVSSFSTPGTRFLRFLIRHRGWKFSTEPARAVDEPLRCSRASLPSQASLPMQAVAPPQKSDQDLHGPCCWRQV
jgi:hypothetical protein